MRVARPLPDGGIELERPVEMRGGNAWREVVTLSAEDLKAIGDALADCQMVLPLPGHQKAAVPLNGRVIPLRGG